LKKVTEVFSRMFHDPHGKVFSVFLDTLIDFVGLHANYLNDWLLICLSRLFNKMGVDVLGSVQSKMQQAVEAVR
jgi:CLIP-associating protein 1/2